MNADVTLASLPIWPHQESLWTQAEHAPDIRETRVRASSVVPCTVAGILAAPSVRHEASAG